MWMLNFIQHTIYMFVFNNIYIKVIKKLSVSEKFNLVDSLLDHVYVNILIMNTVFEYTCIQF